MAADGGEYSSIQAPVVEVAIGVQFTPLPGFTSGHIGWYWRDCLSDWPQVAEAQPLPPQFERLEEPTPTPTMVIFDSNPIRLQLTNAAGNRLVQVQRDKFFLNWRRTEGEAYPGFQRLRDEFLGRFADFARFVARIGFNQPVLNQWEVLYVDQVGSSSGCRSLADWGRFFPGLFPPAAEVPHLRIEARSSKVVYRIEPDVGRLYVSAQPAADPSRPEVFLQLETTARGPVHSGRPALAVEAELTSGHDAILGIFRSLTSEATLRSWGVD